MPVVNICCDFFLFFPIRILCKKESLGKENDFVLWKSLYSFAPYPFIVRILVTKISSAGKDKKILSGKQSFQGADFMKEIHHVDTEYIGIGEIVAKKLPFCRKNGIVS